MLTGSMVGALLLAACGTPGPPVSVSSQPSTPVEERWTITTVAGYPGAEPFSGSGGPAIRAGLGSILFVAVDARRNVFIAETVPGRAAQEVRSVVRMVEASTGVIRHLAGSGLAGYRFDAVTGQWIACCRATDVGAAGAYFGFITALAVDGGNLLIASVDGASRGGVVQRLTLATGSLTRVAGGGSARPGDGGPATEAALSTPSAIAPMTDGSLLIGETGDKSDGNRIRKVAPSGTISTLAGTGPCGQTAAGAYAAAARLCGVTALALSPGGELYLVDGYVFRIDAGGVIQNVVAGRAPFGNRGDGGPAIDAQVGETRGLAFSAQGILYLTDANFNRVRRVRRDGIIEAFAGTGERGYAGDGGPASAARLWAPTSIAVASDGSIFVADQGNGVIRRISTSASP